MTKVRTNLNEKFERNPQALNGSIWVVVCLLSIVLKMIKHIKDTRRRRQSCMTNHHHLGIAIAMLLRPSSQSSSSFKIPKLDVLLVVFVSLSCFFNPCHGSCNQLDQESLSSFFLNISSLLPLKNWSSPVDCCLWEGVNCDDNDQVIGLSLPFRGLKGILSPYITNLTHLNQLNLSHNWLTGPLPDGFFKSLNQLQIIDLSYNSLNGPLSSSSSSYSLPISVQKLDLSNNHFNETLQSLSLNSASNLITLNVSNNSFTGPIPSSLCFNSPSVKYLDFSNNGFDGEIPQGFGNCSKLEVFRLGFNNLSGQLPKDIYNSVQLQQLSLAVNNLYGPIGDGIVNLTNLVILELYGNGFTGMIPREIGKLSNLEKLLLHINNLNGSLPQSLMNCTNLIKLNLRVNSFEGELSALNFSKLVKLSTIDLGNNYFNGSLPVSLFLCKSLNAVRLATNKLVGQIQPDILALQSLSFLSISNNTLNNATGAIKILMGCKNLSTVLLSKSFLNETIPDDESFQNSDGFQNLQILGLGGCKFTGQIPSWLSKLGKLEVIDLSYNQITGTIPDWLGTLPNLFYLDLSFNILQGNFPNKLIGLPRLALEASAHQLDQSYLELPVFVQPNNATTNLQYNQLSNLPPAIYLGNNSLSGNIPIEIGQLKFIHVLDLSNNSFYGNIPDQISQLTNLEKLYLSGNNLSGEIPASLSRLHFLSTFTVANNNLEGPIPTGGQLDTFPATSFEGNPRLCGLILHVPCSITPKPSQPFVSNKKTQKKKILIGLILGICFGIGFTLAMLAFWILSKRRILPRGDHENTDLDTISFNSNSGISTDVGKETSLVIVFPNNTDKIKDLTIFEILKATDNFNQANIIGCGGFGLVYKAILPDGTKLAIKKLSGDMGLMEREFKAEVEVLSTAKHKNLVSLQGYCVHDGHRLLMYSYMENGSLDYWLHEKSDGASRLDWPTRLRIAHGASSGLAYMHQVCEPHIVHRDIKSSNILLDDKFEAHVADFGLSRLILPYETHVTTELVGTLGYIPPEYGQAWKATLKGDMYSFGVVMLELLTGKRPVELFKPKMARELVVWVQKMRTEGKQDQVFDPFLRGKGFEEEMVQVLDVACMCVDQNPFKRPIIKDVVDLLKSIEADKQMPKENQ